MRKEAAPLSRSRVPGRFVRRSEERGGGTEKVEGKGFFIVQFVDHSLRLTDNAFAFPVNATILSSTNLWSGLPRLAMHENSGEPRAAAGWMMQGVVTSVQKPGQRGSCEFGQPL